MHNSNNLVLFPSIFDIIIVFYSPRSLDDDQMVDVN